MLDQVFNAVAGSSKLNWTRQILVSLTWLRWDDDGRHSLSTIQHLLGKIKPTGSMSMILIAANVWHGTYPHITVGPIDCNFDFFPIPVKK